MDSSEIELYLKKSSKWSAILLFAGILFFVATLIYSYFNLNKLKEETSVLEIKRDTLRKDVEEYQKTLTEYQMLMSKTCPEENKIALAQLAENQESKLVLQDIGVAKSPTPVSTVTPNPKASVTPAPVPSATPAKTNDLATAQAKEREGFEALVSDKYDDAIKAFQASENAYNSYHQVYELAQFLRRNKSQLGDPAKKKEIFQTIVKRFPYGAPPDLWKNVKDIAAE